MLLSVSGRWLRLEPTAPLIPSARGGRTSAMWEYSTLPGLLFCAWPGSGWRVLRSFRRSVLDRSGEALADALVDQQFPTRRAALAATLALREVVQA